MEDQEEEEEEKDESMPDNVSESDHQTQPVLVGSSRKQPSSQKSTTKSILRLDIRPARYKLENLLTEQSEEQLENVIEEDDEESLRLASLEAAPSRANPDYYQTGWVSLRSSKPSHFRSYNPNQYHHQGPPQEFTYNRNRKSFT